MSTDRKTPANNSANGTSAGDGLNVFRCFAFLAVYFYHAGWLPFGYIGVPAFFVLSGFLLTPILLDMKQQLPVRSYLLNFYARRALRIFPLYYAYILGGLLLFSMLALWIPVRNEEPIDRFFTQSPWALTYTYNFFMASHAYEPTSFLSHFWSLAVEEQFYFVWPFVILLIPRRHMNVFLLCIMAAGPLIRGLEAWVTFLYPDWFITGMNRVIYTLPFSHLDAFAAGALLALNPLRATRHLLALSALVTIMAGLFCMMAYGPRYSNFEFGYAPYMNGSNWQPVWGYSLINVLFALILARIATGKINNAVTRSTSLDYLGRISYGLYVFHVPIIAIVRSGLQLPDTVSVALSLVITIVIAAFSYEYMEKPLLKLKDKHFARDGRPIHHNISPSQA